jgi:uncharacterized protein
VSGQARGDPGPHDEREGECAPGVRVVPAGAEHFAAILALNEESVAVLAPLSRGRLELLHERASCHRVAVDGDEVVGFVLAFGSNTPHDSVNFRWFAGRYPSFLYVDRVVVAASRRGRGTGGLLYRDLFGFACRRGYALVTCEIDAEPPNPTSVRFHQRFGFAEVGSQRVEYVAGHPKHVSLRAAAMEEDLA